jgi:hypothetical protein
MYLLIEFEDVADEENEQEFNVNQFKDEMSEPESDSDSSSCTGSDYIFKLSLNSLTTNGAHMHHCF